MRPTIAWPSVVVVLAAALVTGWAAALLWRRIDGLAAAAYDLGFFQQVVWNVGTAGVWTSSFHDGSFLGLHFSPILVVPALLQGAVGYDPHVLSLLHAVGVGGLVVAGFLFLRAILRPSAWAAPTAAVIAIGIPLWPTIQWVIRADFRPELAGVTFALLAGWAGLGARPRMMWALAALALLTREDIAYALIVIGLAVGARGSGQMRTQGRALAIVAAIVGLAIFLVIMPWLRDGAPSDTAAYYAWLGSGVGLVLSPILQADRVLAAIARPEPWFAVAGMLVGLGGLPLLRPRWLLLVAPPFLALVLSDHDPQAVIIGQYPLLLVAPMIVAAGMGGRRALAVCARRRRASKRVAGAVLIIAAIVLLAAGLATARLAGPLPPFASRLPESLTRSSGIDELRATARALPDDAPLVADEGLVVPLATRGEIIPLTRHGHLRPDVFVVVDRMAWVPSEDAARRRERLVAGLASSGRPVVADDGRFVIWGPHRPAGVPEAAP